jgi:hypothetical protein
VPSHDRGLLARLDALVELVVDRHGLALLPAGRLAAAEARVAAWVAGLAAPREPTARAAGVTQREAVELLRAVAEGVGLLRVRGDRLEATSLRNAWAQVDESPRAGLTLAAWCHGVHWSRWSRRSCPCRIGVPVATADLRRRGRVGALDLKLPQTSWSEPGSRGCPGHLDERFLPVAVALARRSPWKRAGQRHLPIVVPGGTGNARATPQAAETPRRLVLEGGFAVDGGRDRHLKERLGALGFDGFRAYLQVRCDAGHSVPRIAAELGVGDWQVQAALARLAVRLAPRRQRLAAQRRRYTEERIAARVAALGFADVQAYLLDRVVERSWLLVEVAAELAAHRLTVRRLLDRYGIRRVRRTPAERAAADAGLGVQAVSWQARRDGRLAELGFADLAGYLWVRRVEQGWSVRRMRAELHVGRRWLVDELARLGLRS